MALNRSHSKEGGVVVPGGERCGAGGTGGRRGEVPGRGRAGPCCSAPRAGAG